LENIRKVAIKYPRSAFKKKNKVEDGGALGSRVLKNGKAQKHKLKK
jgi:hypothetical protein